MRRFDVTGRLTGHVVPDPDELFKPEIDRGRLRDLLLDSLHPGTVRWGHALARVTGPDDGPRQLHFTDGTTRETDLVIGADGAFSRVRPAVSPAVPAYTGLSFLEAWFSDVDARHPGIAELVGQGSALAADGERAMFAQRNGGDHVRAYIVQRTPSDWLETAGLTTTDTEGIRTVLTARFAHWAPAFLRMLTDNDGPYVDRPVHALPVPHTWRPSPTVTLLGDAAHLMPPLGVGVNLAMLDATDLALALAASPTVADALRTYEHTMLPRSTDMAQALQGHADDLLSAGTHDFAAGGPPH